MHANQYVDQPMPESDRADHASCMQTVRVVQGAAAADKLCDMVHSVPKKIARKKETQCSSFLLFLRINLFLVNALTNQYVPCRGDANAAGLIFQGWDAAGEGSAAIVYDWERSVLEAVYEAPEQDAGATQQTQDLDGEEDDGLRRVGGPVEPTVNEVHMRILLDHSCIEVYLGTGEVLSTRIYRCLSLLAATHTVV